MSDSPALLRRMGYAPKLYHKAAQMDGRGNVSALCYARPRPINLKAGQSWTLCDEDVTCPKCRAALAARAGAAVPLGKE